MDYYQFNQLLTIHMIQNDFGNEISAIMLSPVVTHIQILCWKGPFLKKVCKQIPSFSL